MDINQIKGGELVTKNDGSIFAIKTKGSVVKVCDKNIDILTGNKFNILKT